MRLRRCAVVALAVTSVALATACTDEPTPPPDPDAVAADLADTKPGQAPLPSVRCGKSGNEPATRTVITTADQVHLAGVRFGLGTRGVLLLPQRGSDLCPFWDYAAELSAKGFHVLAIDMRGTGYSEDASTDDYTADAEAAIKALKAAGAERVVVIGASIGGATALVTAGRLPNEVAGVVTLSYPDNDVNVTGGAGTGPNTPLEAAPLITAPLLICFATGDRQAAANPDEIISKANAPAKDLVGRPGVSHGWGLLKVGDDDVRPDVLNFLESYA